MALDLAQFHDAFFEESFEALDSMESALLKLNIGSPEPELINTIFRTAHSIKGGSATFGFTEVASFTHTLETLLDELRGNRMHVSRSIMDLLLKTVDVVRDMLRAVQTKVPVDAQRIADLQFDLEVAIINKPAVEAPVVAASASSQTASASARSDAANSGGKAWAISFKPYPQLFAHGNDPLRMLRELSELGSMEVVAQHSQVPSLQDLDPESCLLSWDITLISEVTRDVIAQVFDWAEGDCHLDIVEQVSAPATEVVAIEEELAASNVVPMKAAAKADAPAEGNRQAVGDSSSIRVSIEKIDELMNTVGELVITQSMLGQLGTRLEGSTAEELRSGLTQLERNVRELQESVMRVRMLPISFVFSRFPRMVRDLSNRLNKDIELKMTGEHTELDKTVLEKIGDPLIHLVRNSVDHGIEKPEVRKAAGKPVVGTVHLDAYHKGGNITIEVKDDGGGMNKDKILAKARDRGLVNPNDVLTDEQIYDLIFVPGFSTAEVTTDVSGRGVGMDVVRRNVKELGGSIEVKTELGKGSRFVITLPLTLAIVDGQSVAVGSETYIVPLTVIIESMQLKPSMVNLVAGRGEVFRFRDEYLPVVRLHQMFGVRPRATELTEGLLMVVEGEGRRVGLFVDDLLGQQQVVIKSLETNYRRVEGVSGATILGDGSVALILDIPGIIRVGTERLAA
ncbi:MAG TPA: chemotaxis protein CheA [Steroidobacteraceae bacterium]|nr:chemotaxis protein CheA [Steroidobacteraceae bacterium]